MKIPISVSDGFSMFFTLLRASGESFQAGLWCCVQIEWNMLPTLAGFVDLFLLEAVSVLSQGMGFIRTPGKEA